MSYQPHLHPIDHRHFVLRSAIFLCCLLIPMSLWAEDAPAEPIDQPASPDAQENQQEQAAPCLIFVPLEHRENPRQLSFYGVSCFEAERYDWALSHYLSAFALAPSPLLQGTIGRSLHELGLYDPAKAHYEGFLAQEGQAAGADRIRMRLAQLDEESQQDAATVSLESSPPGAQVFVVLENQDWLPLGKTPTTVMMREGDYDFIFESDNYRPRRSSARLRAGDETSVSEELTLNSSAYDISTSRKRQIGGWTLGTSLPITAAGITLLALSAQNTASARELDNHFDDLSDYEARRRELLDDASDYRTWGTITTAVGATGILAGSIVLLLARNRNVGTDDEVSEEVRNRFDFQPLVGVDSIGFQVRF